MKKMRVERTNSAGRGAGRVKGKQPGGHFLQPHAKKTPPADLGNFESPDSVSRFITGVTPPNPQTVRTPNPVTDPNPPTPPTSQVHVTECATIYSVLMACITSSYTLLLFYFAYSNDELEKEKISEFWFYIVLPISCMAMGISFFLKPKREDRPYKNFLYAQYIVMFFVSEFLAIVGYDFEASEIVRACLKSSLYLALLKLLMSSRSAAAKLSDKELSNFLTNNVVMGGVVIGLGQVAFLMFASIQCENSHPEDYSKCHRTLLSQAGETKPRARAHNASFG